MKNVKELDKRPVNEVETSISKSWETINKMHDAQIKKNENNEIAYKVNNETNTLEIILAPHSQVLIPSGIKVNICDKNTYLDANNKSGVATKYRLTVGAKVIDADYRGEVHINLLNNSNEFITITSGQKIVQFIHKAYIKSNLIEISNNEYDNLAQTDRGTGGFASTGEK